MVDDIAPEMVMAIAATARISLIHDAAIRIARTASPLVAHFAAADIALAFDTSPSTFMIVQKDGQSDV